MKFTRCTFHWYCAKLGAGMSEVKLTGQNTNTGMMRLRPFLLCGRVFRVVWCTFPIYLSVCCPYLSFCLFSPFQLAQ